MDEYKIILRNDKTRLYDRFAIFIFILNGIGIIASIIYKTPETTTHNFIAVLIGLAVILMILPSGIIITKKGARFYSIVLSSAVFLLLFWIYLGFWWIGAILMMLIFLYYYSKRELIVTVKRESILYPSLPVKEIKWNYLNNVILKDHLFTIDFKNNKLIQQGIDSKSFTINEQEFNDFCKEQLRK